MTATMCLLILEKVGFGKKGQQKLLRVTINKNLKFKNKILKQCKKAGKKLCVLGRVCHILNLEHQRSLMKAFIESLLGDCPLVWMFCGSQENNWINHFNERALRILYNDCKSSFENLLELNNLVSIHHRNTQLLSIELYKVKHNLSNQVMSELFNSQTDFELGLIYTTAYVLWSLKYFAPKIWNTVPIDIRNSDSLSEFTTKIKSWKPVKCPCNLCCTFVGQVGYID